MANYKRMKKLLFCLALSQPLWAQDFFVRNRPFQAVEKRQGVWMASLPDLAKALELSLTGAGSTWILGETGEEPGEPGVYFQGKRLTSVDANLQVPLQAFLQEIGGRYIENKALGSVDLYAPSKMLVKATNCNNVHLLMFHRSEANGQQVASFGDSVKQTRGLEPVPVDFEDTTHPLWQQWGKYWVAGRMPLVVLVDPSGRILGRWSGQLPPQSQVQQIFRNFVSARSQLNAQRVAMPSGGSGGGFSGG